MKEHPRGGDSQTALRHYEEALRIWPDDAESNYNYAILLEEAGKDLEAEAQYRSALRLSSC